MNRNKIISTCVGVFALGALLGASTASAQTACTFTRSLTIGARGADVTCLQDYLTSTGHFTYSGGSTGYFGPITRSAVAAWQAANGVAPAVGYFGPISQSRYSSLAVSSGTPATVTSSAVTTAGFNTTSVILSGAKSVTWQTSSYPAGVGVNINLLRKVSDSPKSFELIRSLATDTPNDGQEYWIPLSSETGGDIYIEVTCSSTHNFAQGCALTGDPLRVN